MLKANQRETVKFSYERIARFFPPNYSTKQIEDAIVRILEERKREVSRRRDDTERGWSIGKDKQMEMFFVYDTFLPWQ